MLVNLIMVILVFVNEDVVVAQISNCPKENVNFEKVIGLRPPNIKPLLLFRDPNKLPVTLQCLRKCGDIDDCQGFILNYQNQTCYWYREKIYASEEYDSISDSHVAWFLKTCLKVENCNKSWIFERAPGATLVGNDAKRIPSIISRQQCQQLCLNETGFHCRSAKFLVGRPNQTEVIGRCILSDTDRILSASSFRASRSDEEYYGNQCSLSNKEDFCSFEEYFNKTLTHTDLQINGITKKECENKCLNTEEFVCRGYSFIEKSNVCLLHSEDSKIRGPKLLEKNELGNYYEKAPCLNISVQCTDKNMIIRYRPKNRFDGRLYTTGHFDDPECNVKGHGLEEIKLTVPLKIGVCGIIKAKNDLNSTLLSTTMIVQFNSLVQTQADRVVRIGCIYGNSTKVVVGTGVNFTTEYPGSGSVETLINSTNSPHVTMRIVDAETKQELSESLVGQELELIIEAETSQEYDISANHLVAMSDNLQDLIPLIDDRGCPTNLQVFPALIKTRDGNTTRLTAKFQAFKFTTSPIIRFSVVVQFCNGECPGVDCGDIARIRTKRETASSKVQNLSKNSYEIIGKQMTEVPLQLNLTVKGDPKDKYLYDAAHQLIISDIELGAACLDGYMITIFIILWILLIIIIVAISFCITKRYKLHYEKKYMQMTMQEINRNFELGHSNLDNKKVRFSNQDIEYS
nr:uncharacterized protein LOC111427577 isoform X1 [Onthophagus taurus]XP_022918556.1 uncharacterized protein LOC111427577 isoform X1 [Onthophagus taurus]XP_022918557.1 uncharacterized protein LOC111427577 isoform X1 [Onthophagus taurus]